MPVDAKSAPMCLQLAGKLLHPHVVQFKEVFLTPQHLAIGEEKPDTVAQWS